MDDWMRSDAGYRSDVRIAQDNTSSDPNISTHARVKCMFSQLFSREASMRSGRKNHLTHIEPSRRRRRAKSIERLPHHVMEMIEVIDGERDIVVIAGND